MMRWYGALAPASRAAVGGFTLLNEPAHLMEEKRGAMLAWYASAVDDYRRLVVETSPAPPPTLFVNFIETSGMNVYEMAAWIAEHFTEAERAAWVALDVHMYLAWEFPAPGAWSCDASRDEAYRGVFDFISAKVGQLRQAADGAGRARRCGLGVVARDAPRLARGLRRRRRRQRRARRADGRV